MIDRKICNFRAFMMIFDWVYSRLCVDLSMYRKYNYVQSWYIFSRIYVCYEMNFDYLVYSRLRVEVKQLTNITYTFMFNLSVSRELHIFFCGGWFDLKNQSPPLNIVACLTFNCIYTLNYFLSIRVVMDSDKYFGKKTLIEQTVC